MLFCIIAATLYLVWYNDNKDFIGYIKLGDLNGATEWFTRLGNWILIFGYIFSDSSNFVPISLMVTIETVKFIQAIFISNDQKMYNARADTLVQVQSSNLNEELGQISYVFSDKTGTLTCNEMIFKKLIVHGTPYGMESEPSLALKLPKVSNVDFTDKNFLNDLANPKKKYGPPNQEIT